MSAESDTERTTGFGIESRVGWPIGGALGGVIGAAAFGVVLWLFDPEIVEAAIPGLYGIDATGVTGWLIHLLHGAVLGVVFGFLITRRPILGILRADVETDAIAGRENWTRLVAAGFVYGLAIWTLLPVVFLPLWTTVFGADAAGGFPTLVVESMFGHFVFGIVLGLVFAVTVDLKDREAPDTLEE